MLFGGRLRFAPVGGRDEPEDRSLDAENRILGSRVLIELFCFALAVELVLL